MTNDQSAARRAQLRRTAQDAAFALGGSMFASLSADGLIGSFALTLPEHAAIAGLLAAFQLLTTAFTERTP